MRNILLAVVGLSPQVVTETLYGRPQDRIYHVLVSPEFESSGVFFYPPR